MRRILAMSLALALACTGACAPMTVRERPVAESLCFYIPGNPPMHVCLDRGFRRLEPAGREKRPRRDTFRMVDRKTLVFTARRGTWKPARRVEIQVLRLVDGDEFAWAPEDCSEADILFQEYHVLGGIAFNGVAGIGPGNSRPKALKKIVRDNGDLYMEASLNYRLTSILEDGRVKLSIMYTEGITAEQAGALRCLEDRAPLLHRFMNRFANALTLEPAPGAM